MEVFGEGVTCKRGNKGKWLELFKRSGDLCRAADGRVGKAKVTTKTQQHLNIYIRTHKN